MKTKIISLVTLITICCMVIFISCKKDIKSDDPVVTPTETHFAIPAAAPVTGSVSGIIVDENNTPVPGAEVKCSGSTFTTEANGFFVLKNVQLDKYVSTITVNKPGYHKGIRSFSATPTMNYVSIKLIPKSLTGSISATAGGAVNLSNGTILTLQASSVVIKSSGAAYSGTVNVYASYIDPTTSDFSARVPGSMMGQDANSMYVLASTGMMAVELESASGEALQLATGKPASIKLPIPSSLLTKAPATIDTWSLDDRGVWIKEGTATKNGDFYVMQVSHFSFWNCDFPCDVIYLTIHVQDQYNQPLANTLVQLTVPPSVSAWTTTYGYTDSLGNVSGFAPSGTAIDLSLIANFYTCPSALYTQAIGPYTGNTSITVTATLPSSAAIIITGTANDCSNQPITNGTAAIYAGQYNAFFISIVNGTYTVTVPVAGCSAITTASATVLDNSTQNFASSGIITFSGTNVAIPLLTTCSTATEAIFDVIDCQTAGTYIVGTATNASNYVTVSVAVTTPGTYSVSQTLASGITFSGSGNFTTLGVQTIQLQASGTPTSAGIDLFSLAFSNGTSGCTSSITVYPMQAVFTFGGSPGACTSAIVNGTYITSQTFNASNNVVITVDVTNIGDYYIYTDSTNGYSFHAQGSFTTTGLQTVVLNGSGTPQLAQTNVFTANANGMSGCTFTIDVAAMSTAVFTFTGAPGACTSININGTFTAGVPIPNGLGALVNINVTSIGTFQILSNTVNGMTFSSTNLGTFTSLGAQQVYIGVSGTPAVAGVNTFTLSNGVTTSCSFTVPTN